MSGENALASESPAPSRRRTWTWIVTLVVLAMSLVCLFIGYPQFASGSLEKRLVGTWHANGDVSTNFSFAVGSSSPTSGSVRVHSTITLMFNPDHTMVMMQHDESEDHTFNITVHVSQYDRRDDVPSRRRNELVGRAEAAVILPFQKQASTFTSHVTNAGYLPFSGAKVNAIGTQKRSIASRYKG
jgi:hypothetical protein